ncbi:MAG: ATP-binding protein [Phycisphaerae bacterium]|nr:ATP-binding protein [Phycisphaerae bacterium]
MKELVVISGKGGTGKTSLVASFAALAERKVLADCDVDAADLHLILDPDVKIREPFSGGRQARIDSAKCTACGKCLELCRFDAVIQDGIPSAVASGFRIDPINCEGCGVCARFCPDDAIAMEDCVNGEWYVSQTRFGPMVHAKLGIAAENSGRLVTLVRQQAKFVAVEQDLDLIIVDGSPGIGCPVIASITGTDLVLAVTEPTRSGLHDLDRVRQLSKHFGVPMLVCINKFDLNEAVTREIESAAAGWGTELVGRIHYDPEVTRAQIRRASVVEHTDGQVAQDVRGVWRKVSSLL